MIGKKKVVFFVYYNMISKETLGREQGCKYLWRGIEKW
jgi:hypothetical protein